MSDEIKILLRTLKDIEWQMSSVAGFQHLTERDRSSKQHLVLHLMERHGSITSQILDLHNQKKSDLNATAKMNRRRPALI